jgi:predicted component of type VI protein secretion system
MSKITFGRSQDCDIVFDEKIVSRQHGYLLIMGSKVYVVDNNSKNGIYVNGERITGKAQLSYGDEVLVAKRVPLDWEDYVDIDSDETILSDAGTARLYSIPAGRHHAEPKALIDIPSKMEINQNYAEVYRNGEEGADWKVPMKRNIGNAVGKTLGCIISILIVIAVIALLSLL